MARRNRTQFLFGSAGIILSVGIGIYFSIHTYLYPGPWVHSPYDWQWLVLFGGLLTLGALFAIPSRGRLLLLLTLMFAFGFGGYTIYRAGLIQEFIALGALILSALVFGDWLLTRFVSVKDISALERLFISATLGLAGWMVFGTALGFLGWLYQEIIFSSIIIVLLFMSWRWFKQVIIKFRRERSKITHHWRTGDLRLQALFLAIILIFSIGPFLWSLTPTVRWDGLSYHVAAPAIYIENHAIVEIPESAQAYWAHYAEMVYTVGLLLGGQPLPSLLHLIMGLLAAGLTFTLGKRIHSTAVGMIGAVMFFTVPIILYEIGTPYIDAFLATYITALLLIGYIWWNSGNDRWLLLAGVFAGIALGIKLTSVPVLLVIVSLLTFGLWKKYQQPATILYKLFQFGIIALALWLPWLLRDGLWTGNPIFPYFNGLFKSTKWFIAEPNWTQPVQKKSIVWWILLPWNLTTNSSRFYHEAPGSVLMAMPLLALPWILIKWKEIQSTQRIGYIIAELFVVASTILLFLVYPNARYLIPIYPTLALLSAINIYWLFSSIHAHWLKAVLCIIAGIYLLLGQLMVLIRITDTPERYPYNYILQKESTSEYLAGKIPVYNAFQYLNALPDENLKVLGIGTEFRLYTRAHIYGPLFSYEAYQIIKDSKTPEELAYKLDSNGFNYILVNKPEQNYRPQYYTSPALNNEFFRKFTTLLFIDNQVYVYRFDPRGVEKPEALNLLKNPGIEIMSSEKTPVDWQMNGPVKVIQGKNAANNGDYALGIHGNVPQQKYAYFLQSVPVTANEIYTASYWAVLTNGNGKLQLQINWLDSNNQQISQDSTWIPLIDDWKSYSFTIQAPPSAAYAEVVAAVTGDAEVSADDVCFAIGDYCP